MKNTPSIRRCLVGLILTAAGLCLPSAQATTVRLTRLDFSRMQGRFSKLLDHPTVISGRSFPASFAPNDPVSLTVMLDGKVEALDAWIGVSDESATNETAPIWYEVLGDDKMLFQSEPIHLGDPAQPMHVSLTGVKKLVIAIQSAGTWKIYAALADARFTYSGDAPYAVDRIPEPAYILTPKAPHTPRINGASIVGARPGHEFLFKIPASGDRPMTYAAKGLPAGLSLDSATGIITGAATQWGEFRAHVSATNALGTTSQELHVVIGDTLALTPPMGWNSWNCFAASVKASDISGAADAFVTTGLIDHGWTYVNVDDFWETRPLLGDPVIDDIVAHAKLKPLGRQYVFHNNLDPALVGPARDASGKINANSKFPDMAALAAHIHSLGLKAGLYSSPGPLTCGGCTASYGHEEQDAERFAEWGFDYLKYDWCTYRHYFGENTRQEMVKPYDLMGQKLKAQKRDIVFSLCQYGNSNVWEWGASVSGNTWRVAGDINDSWGSMAGAGFSQNGHEAFAGPGHWNDPDMLVVGLVGWGPQLHPTHLSPDEQYTHISLWSLLAAPLLIGCDLTRVDDFTLNLLTNDEVIAIDQDPLGHPARRISCNHDTEVWARVLADGSMAVGLFNRGELSAKVSVDWTELGLSGGRMIRDVWRQADVGVRADGYEAELPRHGVFLMRVSPLGGMSNLPNG